MDKIHMREWVASVEAIVDQKLQKWKKQFRIENGECVQVAWQFEQTHILMDIFWHDHEESVALQYYGPRAKHSFSWHGLNEKTFSKIMDRIGNLAQMTMHPIIDPADHPAGH